MKTYKSQIKLGNTEKTVIAINYSKEEVKESSIEVDRLHHIHVLDRSWSMNTDLPQLIENVKGTLRLMSDNDLISVIWFSSEGQCKTVFKGKSKRDSEDINILLDTLKSPVGATCFSESLLHVKEIIDDLKALCPNFNVTFFTDGVPVVSNEKKEYELIWERIDSIKDDIMALNTIGYGNYYNRALLEEMSDQTMFGRLIHSSKINDYDDIFSHNYQILSDMVSEKVTIDADENSRILYLSNKNTKYSEGSMHLDFLNKIKNQFFIITDAKEIKVNDEIIDVDSINSKIPVTTETNFKYALAYELYYAGKADESLDIMHMSIGDKYFIDKHMESFTADARQEYMKELNKAIFVNKTRFKDGRAEEEYLPKEDAFCVMDLLKVLTTGNNYYIPLDSSEYNRIGKKVTDTFNVFRKSDEKPLAPMNELIFNAKHLNISIRYKINGKVSINPIEAKRVDLPKEVDSCIYRTQTIIKDGNLNVNKITVRIDKDTYDKLLALHQEGVIDFDKLFMHLDANWNEEDGQKTVNSIDVTFNLESLPIINRLYAKNNDPENILNIVHDINVLKAKQKVVKYYINELKNKSYNMKKTEHFAQFNADQIRVLEAHGLNSRLEYQGIGREVAESHPDDFYMSRLLEFTLKGWSSLPKVEDVLNDKKKNAPAEAMKNTIRFCEAIVNNDSITDKDRLESLNNVLDVSKRSIISQTIDLNTQKISKVLTGSWWEKLELDKKNNYTFTKDNLTLIIKNDMVKVHY
ncbi:von Willebrand factor type A domain containing protein [Bacillus phage AR9]|uniref:von Willebrand factor type A domain containing protein n=1 Tax=Bacillus phage AR9 TaxID=1815509 RepID=A0A172JHX3_BPPB1|nr:von Willebrand factor type A domain containing protein [Bacillus phage AR9]AMS01152.1 von Willebrand factor type A domain containing protein [Bacillus phage AR9]